MHIFDPVSGLAATFLIWLTTSAFQRIHWFSLINSIIVVVFLCLMVSMILLRTVSRDVSSSRFERPIFAQLSSVDFALQRHRLECECHPSSTRSGCLTSSQDDVQEDWGWKLVHGEVFRTPRHPMILSVLVGNGSQLCAMVGVTLVFALFGFLSPSNRGSLATVMMVCWTLFGSYAFAVSCKGQYDTEINITASVDTSPVECMLHSVEPRRGRPLS